MDQRRRQRTPRLKVRYFHWSKFKPEMVVNNGRPSLVEEMTTYRDQLPELLKHEGAYVVIKAKDYKIFPDEEAALEYSLKTYWPEPALVKKITAKDPIVSLGGATL